MLPQYTKIFGDNNLTNYFNSKKHTCYAPHVSLNFDSTGVVTACCYNRTHVLGVYPENTILEIWFGEKLKELRESLNRFDFSKGCNSCYKQLKDGNFANSLIKDFDYIGEISGNNILPVMLEIEISTICNYECIMCGGKWSSSIRKNRENLPPIVTPYDEKFVESLVPIMKSLKYVELLGGEPFATPIYYKLIDKLYEINPDTKIVITTNGSIFNKRIEYILERNQNISICISIDSLCNDTYAFIRKNGNLETVLSNIKKIQEIETKMDKKIFNSLAFCPMIQNWRELPSIIHFCHENGLHLAINRVTGQLGGKKAGIKNKVPEVSLYSLSKEQKAEIIDFYTTVHNSCNILYKDSVMGLLLSIKNSI